MGRGMNSDVGANIPGYGQWLYIVAEDHAESDPRREEEKRFLRSITGSANYWEEDELPGLEAGIADKMEVRALHSAALLIAYFQVMADEASKLLQGWPPPASAPVQAPSRAILRKEPVVQDRTIAGEAMKRANQMDGNQVAFTRFVRDDLAQAMWYWRYLSRVWTQTADPDVNTVAQAAFDNVESAFNQFFDSLRKATETLAGNSSARDARVSLLKTIVAKGGLDGADPGNPRAVADLLRKKRSDLMGATAAKSRQAGAWKIGYLHVADILNGNADIRANLHIVSRVNFNQQFEAWRAQGETLDESLANGLRTEASKRAAKLSRKVDDT
jgi:hypothetical protein